MSNHLADDNVVMDQFNVEKNLMIRLNSVCTNNIKIIDGDELLYSMRKQQQSNRF